MKIHENIYHEIFNNNITLKKRSLSFTKLMDNKDSLNLKIKQNLNPEKKIGNYILGKKLGQGTFGIVVLGKHEITGESVAIKILDKEKIVRESDKTRLEREIRIMKIMYHNNIVHLYQVIENSKELFLIMEYISGKELFDYIINKRHLDELESCKFYQQIISGIEYLGKTKVAHRDLKPENLLLDSKKNIKIVDFGLSNTYFQNELLSTACGSPCYAAPEMLSGEKYNGINIDIWSSGIVLYAMLCGYLPFEDNDNPKLYKKIIKGVFETPEFLSSNAVDLLHRILNVDPKKRYTIAQIKEHPWFNQINPKINMSEGLLIDNYIIPFDEEIINKMVNEYSYNEQQIKVNLLFNKHNHITATYFLILKTFIRIGKKSIGDMTSQLFIDYINDQKNLFSSYDYDLNYIIVERILNKKNTENNENLNKKDGMEKEKEKEEEKNKENIFKNEVENEKELKKKENKEENENENDVKLNEEDTIKSKRNSKYKHNNVNSINNINNIHNIKKEYNTIEKDKVYETLEIEKNNSGQKIKIKERITFNKKNNNIMTLTENKEKVSKKESLKSNLNKKKLKSTRENNINSNLNIHHHNSNSINKNKVSSTNKKNKNNTLSQKYFYSTFTENNLRKLNKTNEDSSSIEQNNQKKIINRISLLKDSIIKSLNKKNKNNQTNKKGVDNSKDINVSTSIFSSPQPNQNPGSNPHCFSNKNFLAKTNLSSSTNKYNNEIKYTKIDAAELLKDKKIRKSKERQKNLNLNNLNNTPTLDNKNKLRGQHEIIRIIQRIKNKTKGMNSNTNTYVEKTLSSNNGYGYGYIFPPRSNFTTTNFYINSASRVSRTPNNLIRDIDSKYILEQNINNDLNKKLYEINVENKSENRSQNQNQNDNNIKTINNGNNINIHINLTNIYKNVRPPISQNKEESLYSFNKDKIKIIQNNDKNIKNINNINKLNQLIRQNKFIDNVPKKRKYFIDTSVSLEKMNEDKWHRRQIESENKENRFLMNRINQQEIINNFRNVIDKNNELKNINIQIKRERDMEDTSVQRKQKDIRYLKIKSKNRKFNELKINKINNLNNNNNDNNSNNNENINLNSLINNIHIEQNNLIKIKKKNSVSNKYFYDNINKRINHMSINHPSFNNISDNNSNIKVNNSNLNNKSIPKQLIYNTKQMFKSINTSEFYQTTKDKFTTSSNFFPNRLNKEKEKDNKEATNFEFYRDKIFKKEQNNKPNILSERNPKIKIDNYKNRNDANINKKNNFLKPFDLNSLVFFNNNNSNIKDKISQILNSKDINYNENNNKYNCSKKDIKFELNVINLNEYDGTYIIKSFHKTVNIKLKNVYNNMIFKLINNIK